MNIQFISEYLEYLEVEKGLAQNTLEAYRRDLTDFVDFCYNKGENDITDIKRSDINSYILKLTPLNCFLADSIFPLLCVTNMISSILFFSIR